MSNDTSEVVAAITAAIAAEAEIYYYLYKLGVYENLFVGIVYGAYIVLYVTSVYVLLSKPGFTSSSPKMFMFGITTFMFVLGTIARVLETVLGVQIIQLRAQLQLETLSYNDVLRSEYRMNVINAVGATIARLMYILSDIICAWRAVVLWNRDKRVIAILLLFILGTIAAAGCELGISLDSDFHISHYSFEGYSTFETGALMIMGGPTLATNLLSTGLIAWKAWQYRISVRKHLSEGSGSMRVDRVFALLIESGFIYCCIWIISWISAFGVLSGIGTIVVDDVLLYIAGLYPTLIVILVGMQMSPVEHYSTYSTGVQCTRMLAHGPPKDGNMPLYAFTIPHKYASDFDSQSPSTVSMKPSGEESSLMQ